MRPLVLIALVGAALLVTAIAALTAWQDSDRPALAAPALVIGFDMNPAGNTCPGDGVTDCTLGTIDTCVQVPSGGGLITLDVFLSGLPSGGDFLSFSYVTRERNDLPVGVVTSVTHADPSVNLIYQTPPLAALVDFSEPPGVPLNGWYPSVADLNGGLEVNPPFTKGVLTRLQIDTTGRPDGVYGLTIRDPVIAASPSTDDYCNPDDDGDTIPDAYADGCDVLDANDGYGLVAVGVDCSAGPPPTPTPSPTSTATPTPSPTPPGPTPSTTPTPGTPTPVPPDLVAGWNYACYLGGALPVPEALAHIMPGVQALYHLRADQGYDKWFPARPDLSTITDLSPFEPLFILMANDSDWPQTPADTPPTGLDLAQGWNSACYSGQTKDASSATGGITGQYEALYLLASNQGWKRFIPTRPEISNLDQLKQFAAVLVLVTQPEGARWVFDP